MAELINRLYPKYIVKYHEHDSLLENRPEEELTEAERKEAWEQWEQEKQGILNESKIRAENMQRKILQFGHSDVCVQGVVIYLVMLSVNPGLKFNPV